MSELRIVHVVSGLAVQINMILMGKRKPNKLRPDLWELPGGKVEAGEGLETALAREWQEELGFKIIVGYHLGTEELILDVRLVLHLYTVEPWSGRFPATPKPIDHAALDWFDYKHAMERLPCSPGYYLHYRHLERWLTKGLVR